MNESCPQIGKLFRARSDTAKAIRDFTCVNIKEHAPEIE